ncbi:MAG: hypothetical protein KGL53_09670, partial [Elusimicrobia bacterium]|nr:hypothetical protein [Elusimicrobiota bacterium]
MRARALVVLLLFSAAACADPPLWVRRTPVLRVIWRPWATPYLENPKFSFSIRRTWTGPEFVPGGVRFHAPHGSASISV